MVLIKENVFNVHLINSQDLILEDVRQFAEMMNNLIHQGSIVFLYHVQHIQEDSRMDNVNQIDVEQLNITFNSLISSKDKSNNKECVLDVQLARYLLYQILLITMQEPNVCHLNVPIIKSLHKLDNVKRALVVQFLTINKKHVLIFIVMEEKF